MPSDPHAEAESHDELYARLAASLPQGSDPLAYAAHFQRTRMEPLYLSGNEKGYVKGQCWKRLERALRATGRSPGALTVLDAGCGLGELSVFLACQGFQVVGVELSPRACEHAAALAERYGVGARCRFLAASLESLPLPDASVDGVIGHASLHHFIKYPGVPAELRRVMRPGAEGHFADSFGEFPGYHVFHRKAAMARLGDVILTRRMLEDYFQDFELTLTPTDWFVMLDKIGQRYLPARAQPAVRALSRLHFALDRRIPARSSLALRLSGSVLTSIRKRA